ncbi:amino acid ABC transporter substrate-binding protein, PAAT family [Epibacterium ulvae]|uniref:Amino acid ABC transporter substrate-binding protein, PAAT family n=2 Tax=Epibacterium ulvae TaxID=1156985 RepID=A0A1G5R811_9RHOB|nr:amino acid ABC transporter substrate-binding protein, PAAT family [Epibacterium ulvae]
MLRSLSFLMFLLLAAPVAAEVVTVNTVTRPPFSMEENGEHTGFTIELLRALSDQLDWELDINREDSFADMLDGVAAQTADIAAANISITATREINMDFSHPIFESGLQIMIAADDIREPSLIKALWSFDLLIAICVAFVLLFGGGMLMWTFERRAQPYFDRPLKEAWFPSFWWALNLVVNGGFEERVPRTPIGRIFGVILVISSLFVVSVFVAKITAVMTVEAISGSVNSVNDLYGKQVGTIKNSTAAGFLDRRDVDYKGYDGLEEMIQAFEERRIRIVVFDAPILDYYVVKGGSEFGRTVGQPFLQENYGLAFPTGSPLKEQANQVILRMRENGRYDEIYQKWFGHAP